jgi:hypothetical protein
MQGGIRTIEHRQWRKCSPIEFHTVSKLAIYKIRAWQKVVN